MSADAGAPGPADPVDFDAAVKRLRAEHTVSIEWHPGTTEWSCSCGTRTKGGAYRTERQTTAASERHLRAELRKILGAA